MTIRLLKELIKDLPDDMRIYADDGCNGMFSDDNSEFLLLLNNHNDMAVLQTREDFNTDVELNAWCEWAGENDYEEYDFWKEFAERGYVPADFNDEDKEEWADVNLRNYGFV